MNQFLRYFNMAGVASLAILCLVQWNTNRRVNLEAAALKAITLEQAEKVAQQDKFIKGATADLEDFRKQAGRAHIDLKKSEARVADLERANRQLATDRDQCQAALKDWQSAVTTRDEHLKQLETQAESLAQTRNETVEKFNDLATKYNGLVKDLQETRLRLAAMATNAVAR